MSRNGAPEPSGPRDASTIELYLLGSFLIAPDGFFVVADMLAAEDFLVADHRVVFSAIARLVEDGEPVDPVTVLRYVEPAEKPQAAKVLSKALDHGGVRWSEPTLIGWARAIRQGARLRHLAALAARLSADANEQGADPVDVIDRAAHAIQALASDESEDEDRTAVEIATAAQDLRSMRERGRDATVLSTGLHALDRRFTTGLRAGAVTILAALTTRGKTSLALQIGDYVAGSLLAREAPGSVLYFSLEMTAVDLHRRRLHSRAEVPLSFFERSREFAERGDELERLALAEAYLRRMPLRVIDRPDLTASRIRAIARRQQRRRGLSLVVIDYVGLVTPEDRSDSREQQVAAVSRGIKGLARELSVPVIAVAQLNRQADARTAQRRGREIRHAPPPQLSHLRESGALEQDADNVLMLYCPNEEDPSEVSVIIRKQRQGPRDASATLRFRGEFYRFEDPAGTHAEAEAQRRDLE